MRVLFITNTFPPAYTGGAEVANYHTCRGLIRRGVDCSILVLNNRVSDWPDTWYEVDGIPVHRIGHMLPRSAVADVFDPWVYRLTRTELRRLKPDLVHIHNVSGATLAPYLACRGLGIPVVNTLHDLWMLCPNNMLYRRDGTFCDPGANSRHCGTCFRRYDFWGNVPRRRQVFAWFTSAVAAFVCPSQALIERHVEAGFARDRFRLVRLGFEESAAEDPRDSRAESSGTGFRVGRPTLFFAGGGVEVKGANVLLEALPLLLQRVPGLRVLVAGGGEEGLLAQFRSYAPAVQVLGSVPFRKMNAYYAAADLTLNVSDAAVHFGSSQHLAALSVGAAAAQLAPGGGKVLVTRTLAVGPGSAVLDVTDNALTVDYPDTGPSPLADVAGWIRSGYRDGPGGCWDGPGIASSVAAADAGFLTAVGVLDNSDPVAGGKATFAGETVDATSVLVTYTYWGDVNLDGVVDADDYDIIDRNFLFPPTPANTGWWTGDFTYDGAIDANDYDRIDRVFLFQGAPLTGGGAVPTPEPATLAIVGLGGLGMLLRRRARGA